MPKGMVASDVRNKERGAEILSLFLDQERPGAFVRVTGRLVKVDRSGIEGYPYAIGKTGKVRANATP